MGDVDGTGICLNLWRFWIPLEVSSLRRYPSSNGFDYFNYASLFDCLSSTFFLVLCRRIDGLLLSSSITLIFCWLWLRLGGFSLSKNSFLSVSYTLEWTSFGSVGKRMDYGLVLGLIISLTGMVSWPTRCIELDGLIMSSLCFTMTLHCLFYSVLSLLGFY